MKCCTIRALTFLLIATTLSACVANQPHKLAQTPSAWELVRSGRRAFDKGDLIRAEGAFDRALVMQPAFAPALAGKALVEGNRKHYRNAEVLLSQANKAARTPEERMFLNLTWLRFHELQLHEPGLQETERQRIIADARISFQTAQNLQPSSTEANYRMAQVYKAALEFQNASAMFYRVLGNRESMGAIARSEWDFLQRILQLNPRTTTARRIALSERLTWREVIALLTEELRLHGHIARLRRGGQPSFKTPGEYALVSSGAASNDRSHPLGTMADIGIRGLERPGTLNPERPMTRGVFALVLEDILIKLAGDKRLPVKFIGRPSRFFDVRPDHYAYNAIMVATTLKLLHATNPDEFGLLEPVTGIEALSALQRLKGLLRLS